MFLLVRSSSPWRTGNADCFIFQIESRYVSRIVTKVFLGNFGCVEDIFNDFGVPNMIFMTFWSLRRLTSQGHMVAYKDPCWTVRHGGPKITIFRLQKWSRDMFVGLSLKCFWVILDNLNQFLRFLKLQNIFSRHNAPWKDAGFDVKVTLQGI